MMVNEVRDPRRVSRVPKRMRRREKAEERGKRAGLCRAYGIGVC